MTFHRTLLALVHLAVAIQCLSQGPAAGAPTTAEQECATAAKWPLNDPITLNTFTANGKLIDDVLDLTGTKIILKSESIATMVRVNASALKKPWIQLDSGATICLYNLHIIGSGVPLINVSKNTNVILINVDITNSSVTGRTLIQITNGGNLTMLNVRLTANNATRLVYVDSPNTASTFFNASNSTQMLSDVDLRNIYSGENYNSNVNSLMQATAARATTVNGSSVVDLSNTSFMDNRVLLELVALDKVYAQMHNVSFTNNTGEGIPVTGSVRNSTNSTTTQCCVEVNGTATTRVGSSLDQLMRASWTASHYAKWVDFPWHNTVDCSHGRDVLLVTAANTTQMDNPGINSTNCSIPVETRIVSHLLYSLNGTVWLKNVTMNKNTFSYGSLIQASEHSSVVMQNFFMDKNVAQVAVNATGFTEFVNKTGYQTLRVQDKWTRDLNIPTSQDSFYESRTDLQNKAQKLAACMQNPQIFIGDSAFRNNMVYQGLLRAWGTRVGEGMENSDLDSYRENSTAWYLRNVNITDNHMLDIGLPQNDEEVARRVLPSIIGFVHVNATLDNVHFISNQGLMLASVEVSSMTVMNSKFLANSIILPQIAPSISALKRMPVMWYSKWATVELSNTIFVNNCWNSNTSLLRFHGTDAILDNVNFLANTLNYSSSSLVTASDSTQLTLTKCKFTENTAESLVYSFNSKHVETKDVNFIANNGTCMYINQPQRVFESVYARTNLTNVTFEGNRNASNGVLYAVLLPGDSISVDTSIFTNNEGVKGGALVFEQFADGDVAKLTVGPNATFTNNTAEQHGGAITVIGGALEVASNTSIMNNAALGTGGGIYADVSNYNLTNVIVRGNTAQSAAGLALVTNRSTASDEYMFMSSIKDCTIEDNYMNSSSQKMISPAVLNCGLGGGGGLCLVSPAANLSQVVDTRIVNNAAKYGGAIFIDCGLRSTDSDCRTDVTLMEPYAIISRNTASTPASSVAMLSSKQVMRVKCSRQSDFRSLADLMNAGLQDCGAVWQMVEGTAGTASTLGVSTGPKEVRFSLTGAQLQYNPGGASKVVSGSAWDATVTLHDDDGNVMVDMLDDIVISLTAIEEDLVMISGNHPGDGKSLLSSQKTTEGKFQLTNIITWPRQSDPNNKQYTLRFTAESSHSNFPIVPKDLNMILPRCTLGEYLLSSTHACQTCRSLNSIKPLFSLRPDIRCEPCPENGACSRQHGMLLPTSQFFQPSFLLPQIVRCPIPEACNHSPDLEEAIVAWKEELQNMDESSPDKALFCNWLQFGNGTVNGSSYSQKNELFMKLQCSRGYQGFLCGDCAKHYGRYFGRCQRCVPVWANTVVLFLVIAGMLGVVALLTSGHIRKTLRKHGAIAMPGITFAAPMNTRTREPHMNRPATQSALPSCLRWLDITPNLSPQAFEKVSHIFKVLTTFVQVNSILRGVQWLAPRPVRQFFSQVDFTSSPSAWVSLDCSLQRLGLDSEQLAIARSVFMILLPAFCILIAYSTWMLLFAWNLKKKRLANKSWKGFIVARFWLSTVQICYILYPVVTINIFDVFKCDPLSGAADEMERSYWDKYKGQASICNGTATSGNVPLWHSKRLWTQSHETECGSGRHAALMWSLGLLSLIFFAVGVPVGLVALLLTHRHQLHEPKTELKFGFLYEEYKEQFSFWESVIMARKVALLVIIIALPYIRSTYRQYIQVSSSILVMMVCLLLHLTYQPFTDKLLNRLETVSIVMTIANMYMITYWMIPDMSETIKLLVMVVMLFLNTLVIAYFLFELVYQFKDEAKAVADHVCGPKGCCSCLKGCRKQPAVDDHRCANMNNAQLVHHDVERNDLAADDQSNAAAQNGVNDVAGATVYRYGLQDTQFQRDKYYPPKMALPDYSGNHLAASAGYPGGKEQSVDCSYDGTNVVGRQLRFEVPPPPSSSRSPSSSAQFPQPPYSSTGARTPPTSLYSVPITTVGGVQPGRSFMHDVIQPPRIQPVLPVQPAQHVSPASHDSDVRSSGRQQWSEMEVSWAPSGGERDAGRLVAERWSDQRSRGLPEDDNPGYAGDYDWRQL